METLHIVYNFREAEKVSETNSNAYLSRDIGAEHTLYVKASQIIEWMPLPDLLLYPHTVMYGNGA